jgi:hypothetical protein
MSRYAETTDVSVDRSKAEIEKMIGRHGARKFLSGWDEDAAFLMFELEGRRIRFLLRIPNPNSDEYRLTDTGRLRSDSVRRQAYEQAVRQRWRALGLVIRAKLEAVELGITTVEEEFLAHIMLPNGQSVGEEILPRVAESYRTGNMAPMLPALGTQPALPAGKG